MNFTYKKNKPNIQALLGGSKIQILNCFGLEDVNLLLNDIHISYPTNWDMILNIMGENYRKVIYEYNLNNIVSKVTNKNVTNIMNVFE